MSNFVVTKNIKYIIFGMLLGDANLQTFNSGKTYRLNVIHSLSKIEYLKHKYEIFKDIIRMKIKLVKKNKNNKVFKQCYFNTITSNKLKFFYDSFYKDNKKVLPKLLHRYLNPISIAYWYMDDGSIKWKNRLKAIRICTDNFTKKEVIRLASILNEKFNLNVDIFKWRSRFRLYIHNDNCRFNNLIKSYVIECMKYKLP
jgi:hypothetical protein